MTDRVAEAPGVPANLRLIPAGRHPTRLDDGAVHSILHTPLPVLPPSNGRCPHASIVIVTHNQFAFTWLCLMSLIVNTPTEPEYEIIVIDNASTDETLAALERAGADEERIQLVRNEVNVGFAAAVNQGLAIARGDLLAILNNDTLVAPGWLHGLSSHLAQTTVGLVGPVTNCAANEAQIDASYETYAEFEQFATRRARTYRGSCFSIPMLTMFCIALRRDTYQHLGPLDERFGIGTFEDDDYSLRARKAGYEVLCAEDVFVHHFGQASFGELVTSGAYASLLGANRSRFEDKWRISWRPHAHRASGDYEALVQRIRATAHRALPENATVVVTSRGDAALLDLGVRRRAWHFPRLADGTYAGNYPVDSTAAITHLEELRAAGADHVLFPRTSLWWLDHYSGFRDHLSAHYRPVVEDDETCWIYDLRGGRNV